MRKLEETSWLAQHIRDRVDVEFDTYGYATLRYKNLQTFKIFVNEADNPENETIYYHQRDGKRQIVICDIPSMMDKHGTDFCRYGMRNKLHTLQISTPDDEGMYTVIASLTHDLNSATINDISELLYQLSVRV